MGSYGTMNKTALVDFVENESEITVRYRAFTISYRTKLVPLSLLHKCADIHPSANIAASGSADGVVPTNEMHFVTLRCLILFIYFGYGNS